MEFVWDERKYRTNQKKHRVSFETALQVFDDPFHVSIQEREVEGEVRWQTIGMVNIGMINGVHLRLVAHTFDDGEEGDVIRIFSARKATRRERETYAEGI